MNILFPYPLSFMYKTDPYLQFTDIAEILVPLYVLVIRGDQPHSFKKLYDL